MNFKNSKKQGDAGVGSAIQYFTGLGYTVCIPLTDSQDYDLIVDNGSKLDRVQVKTTSYKEVSGNFSVSLTVKGGNRSGTGKIKKINIDSIDSLFILTPENRYYIPILDIGVKSGITLYNFYDKYKV